MKTKAAPVSPADGSPDVLTQARKPTLAEINAAYMLSQVPVTVAERVLSKAAPRILALAYREAARICDRLPYKGVREQFALADAINALWAEAENLESLADSVERSQ